jgi:hypothetical protein
MKFNFPDNYTRKDNPDIYYCNDGFDLKNSGVTSFEKFPRIVSAEFFDLSNNLFSDLSGSPKLISQETNSVLLVLSDNKYLKSLNGLNVEIACPELILRNCPNLENLSNCPANLKFLSIEGSRKIKSLEQCVNSLDQSVESLYLADSGITSLRHIPKNIHLKRLDLRRCSSLVELDLKLANPVRTLFVDLLIDRPWAKLINLHSLLHDEKMFSEIKIYKSFFSSPYNRHDFMQDLSLAMLSLSDPFEFQEWCMQNGLTDYM